MPVTPRRLRDVCLCGVPLVPNNLSPARLRIPTAPTQHRAERTQHQHRKHLREARCDVVIGSDALHMCLDDSAT